ncbi:MAG: hypothetical protein AB8G11_24295 [Saprospiraceae bacterium]
MNKATYSIIGFALFICGMLALVLQLVGVQLIFLTWLDNWGGGIGLSLRLLMIIIGIVIIVMTRSGEQMHEEYFE